MKYQHILALALGIVAIAACQRENPMGEQSKREIKFTATMSTTTKATATAFEEGDEIGLSISSPVDIENVLLTPADDKLVPEKTLYWPAGMKQKDTARFIAFYPYEFSTYAYGGFNVRETWNFGTASTQYKADEFALQDYMSAVTIACPADESVELKFKHLMSRFNLTIVDKLTVESFRDVQADSFRSIQIDGLYTWFKVNFAEQTLVADPDGGESYPYYPARTGEKFYTLLLPPQSASPEIVVTLNSGKKMKYVATNPINFVSGKQVAATLTLQEDAIKLSYQIEDWEDDPTVVNFIQKYDGPIPNDEIWYTTTDGKAVELINTSAFNVAVVSNTYADGKGVVKFADAITAILEGEDYRNPFENSMVKFIRLPESMETIKAGFEGCNYLESIQFPSHLAYVPGHLVANNYLIRELEFPETDDIASNWSNGPIAFCFNLGMVTGPYATQDNRCLIKDNKLFAFAGAGLKSYTIPDGVKSLGGEVFAGYQDLEQIIIPESVEEIGYLSFSHTGITEITIPETVTYIGTGAFESCTGLKTVHIPDGTNIETQVFENCKSLTSFTGRFATADGRCLIKNGVLYAFAFAGLNEYTLPEGLRGIESGFVYGPGIPSLTLPASLEFIRLLWGVAIKEITCLAVEPPALSYSHSLNNLSNLEAIYVPAESVDAYKEAQYWSALADKIQAIPAGQPNNEIWYTSSDGNIVNPYTKDVFGATFESNTYEGGKGIIRFDADVTQIGRAAFDGCSTLETISIPASVTSIGDWSFRLCTSLYSFKGAFATDDGRCLIQDGALKAFASAGLTHYSVPEGVTEISMDAMGRNDLSSVTLPNSLRKIGLCAFMGCGNLTAIDLPDGLLSIGQQAFSDCSFTTITIPSSVTSLGPWALLRCGELTSVTVLPAMPPTIGGDELFDADSTFPIYVPASSVDAYKTANVWSTYADRIEPLAAIPEAVDLGLPSGIKWASFNLGAAAPEQAGDLFAWGEVIPNQTGNYKFGMRGDYTKYNGTDKLTVLETVDDAAVTNLGGGWRMPTHEEFGELRDYCTYSIETVNGVEGYRFTSKNNQNSIFLPFAAKTDFGYSFYWSSTLDTDNTDYPFVYAHTFGLAPEEIYTHNGYGSSRDSHHSIRPVYVSE